MYQNNTYKYDQETLNRINKVLNDNIEKVFEIFDIDVRQSGKYFVCSCPIHQGSNLRACNICVNEDFGFFTCRSHGCEKVFQKSLIGFVRGILSAQHCNWAEEGDKTYSFHLTIEFIKKHFNIQTGECLAVNTEEVAQRNITKNILQVTKKVAPSSGRIERDLIRKSLQIPSTYYLKRGYSAGVLDKYDVGLCTRANAEMAYRTVVPIYDDTYSYMVGCTGRSIYEECEKCKCHHPPTFSFCRYDPKWKHSAGFDARNHLYNYWFAKPHIEESKTLILVESPGNVWRLEEAGIHNSVAIFGLTLKDEQQILVEKINLSDIIVVMDNDENGAGQKAAIEIKKQLSNLCRVRIVQPPKGDIGDMNIENVKRLFNDN